jgi:RNA polymerase sigma-70 factor, ECF subfamily
MSEFKNRLRLIKDSALVSKDDKDTGKIQNEVLLTFEEALKRYLDSLYSTAFELTGNKQEAEDLIQEVCLRAFKNFYQLKSGRKAKAWLYRILINTFINKYRKELKGPPIVDMDVEELLEESLMECSGNLRSSNYNLLSGVIDEEIEEVLSELHVDLRTVVWLSDVEGFSQKEISEMLECPIGTVASRLHRGRKFLRKRLSDYVRKRGIIKE